MARRSGVEAVLPSPAVSRRILYIFQLALQVALAVALVLCAVTLYFKAEQFVIADKRFALTGPPEPGAVSEHFAIENAHFASEEQITTVFRRDFGRSIYLCPIAERRRRLLAIDWVKNATVQRIWPNRLVVRIAERRPVAFAQIPGKQFTMGYAMLDADGVLLDPQRAVKMELPVLSGILPNDSEPLRHERVRRFLRMQSELGPMMANISEIDVSDVDNLKVTEVYEGRTLTLLLGNQKFRERMQSFLDNYPDIREHKPYANVLDLRLSGRITAVGSGFGATGNLAK